MRVPGKFPKIVKIAAPSATQRGPAVIDVSPVMKLMETYSYTTRAQHHGSYTVVRASYKVDHTARTCCPVQVTIYLLSVQRDLGNSTERR